MLVSLWFIFGFISVANYRADNGTNRPFMVGEEYVAMLRRGAIAMLLLALGPIGVIFAVLGIIVSPY